VWKEQPLEWLLFPLARKNYFDEKPQAGKESKPCATVAQGRNGTEKRLHWDYAAID
jgi:hypothetical protein